jgi:predicted phosphodiesterase
MGYIYNHLIPQNTAPKGAKNIGVYDSNGEKVFTIPLGRMTPPTGTKRYSFGLVSDTHVCPEANDGAIVSARLDSALTWFEEQGAVFVAHCGDIVNFGFENPAGTYNPSQYEEYKRIRNLHPNLPIYAVSGNHDQPVPTYIDKYKECTGHDIRFTVEHNDDVFIFMGQPKVTTLYVDGSVLPVPELAWLETQLSENADKRCFVFFHPYIVGDSGDTLGLNPNDLLPSSGYVTNLIKNALINHGRAVLFHGHAHFMPSMQELDDMTNYTDKNGFPSVHVPSLGWAAYVDDNTMIKDTSEGFGAIVDVYDDCIVINGRDFVRNEWSPLGTFKIDTK